jgi:hypothetical protein
MARLKPNGMFHTPDSADALWDWLARLPAADGVRVAAITAAMMAWNLAAKLSNESDDNA